MKKMALLLTILLCIAPYTLVTQDKYALTSEKLDAEEKQLNAQIKELNKKLGDLIDNYKLLEVKDIKMVPYQMSYTLDKDSISLEQHSFIRDPLYKSKVIGIKTRSIKIYTSGKSLTKTVSAIYEKNFESEDSSLVNIVDPSPASDDSNSIEFSYTVRGAKLMDKKKFADMKNTTAFPVRNSLKKDFIIPHLTAFYDSLLFIAESYMKSKKDADSDLADFLRESIK